MKVLGIIGSPRRERGLSQQIVARVLEGAEATGAETELLYLIDSEPEYCIHCGHGCFDDCICAQEDEATTRSEIVDAADALVICAPVYCWQANGLTTAFFDKLRQPSGPWNRETPNGRRALGIAVAGGTGSGVFSALQSIYAWLCLWKFRPLDPVPVTRFNLAQVIQDAPRLGGKLANAKPEPFGSIADLMLCYDRLPYMDFGRVDEFRWLAQEVRRGLDARSETRSTAAHMQGLLEAAAALGEAGDTQAEAEWIIQAYQIGAAAW